MNRGSPPWTPLGRAGLLRFNEAPIHESGKLGCHGVLIPRFLCFNEAPIHESGK